MSHVNRVVSRFGVLVDMRDEAVTDLTYYDDVEPRDAPHRVERWRLVPDRPPQFWAIIDKLGRFVTVSRTDDDSGVVTEDGLSPQNAPHRRIGLYRGE